MDPITTSIIAAVAGGAASGVTDTAKKAIVDGYEGLKALLKKKFGNKSDVIEAIDKLEAKPESQGRRTTLAEELNETNAAADPELSSAAAGLLELIKAMPQGEKHIQTAVGSGIAQADHGGTASVKIFGAPSEKNNV